MDGLMNEIIAIMTDRHGLDVSPFEESFLAKSCQQRMEILGIPTVAAYHAYLAGSGEEGQALFQGLRVAHSEFFRNPLGFALLEQVVLPGLARARKADGGGKIRIWSAACAAGQEAYSLAILMNELVGERQNGLSYHIFATDVSPLQLALAAEGLYDPASMLNVRAKHLEACFTPGRGRLGGSLQGCERRSISPSTTCWINARAARRGASTETST
jgi:chemotaxis methyl-accepting protein methylase